MDDSGSEAGSLQGVVAGSLCSLGCYVPGIEPRRRFWKRGGGGGAQGLVWPNRGGVSWGAKWPEDAQSSPPHLCVGVSGARRAQIRPSHARSPALLCCLSILASPLPTTCEAPARPAPALPPSALAPVAHLRPHPLARSLPLARRPSHISPPCPHPSPPATRQVWDVDSAQHVHELASLREPAPTALCPVPTPRGPSATGAAAGPLGPHRPVLAVGRAPRESGSREGDTGGSAAGSVAFYSFASGGYVHTLLFHSVRARPSVAPSPPLPPTTTRPFPSPRCASHIFNQRPRATRSRAHPPASAGAPFTLCNAPPHDTSLPHPTLPACPPAARPGHPRHAAPRRRRSRDAGLRLRQRLPHGARHRRTSARLRAISALHQSLGTLRRLAWFFCFAPPRIAPPGLPAASGRRPLARCCEPQRRMRLALRTP